MKKAPGATYAIEAAQLQEHMSTARRARTETTASGVGQFGQSPGKAPLIQPSTSGLRGPK